MVPDRYKISSCYDRKPEQIDPSGSKNNMTFNKNAMKPAFIHL